MSRAVIILEVRNLKHVEKAKKEGTRKFILSSQN